MAIPSGEDTRPCQLCDAPGNRHEGRAHAFTPPGTRVDTAQFGPRRSERRLMSDDTNRHHFGAQGVSQTPFDPVLRQALVDAGVITPEQLEQARLKIEMMTANVTGSRSV